AVLEGGAQAATRLGVHALDLAGEDEAHDVDVVQGKVVDDADVARARSEGAHPTRCQAEKLARITRGGATLELRDRRVEALDVAGHEAGPGFLDGVGETDGFTEARRYRLFDQESLHAGREGGEGHFFMKPGRHRNDSGIE